MEDISLDGFIDNHRDDEGETMYFYEVDLDKYDELNFDYIDTVFFDDTEDN